MGVGGRDGDAPLAQASAKLTDANPVRERRFMQRKVVDEPRDGGAITRTVRAADQLRDDEWRQHDQALGQGVLQRVGRAPGEEVDPGGGVSDDAAHVTRRGRW